MEVDIQRFENILLMEMGECKKSGDGLEKRLSKLEEVSGRLDGVFDSIFKLKEGRLHIDYLFTENPSLFSPHHPFIQYFIEAPLAAATAPSLH